MGSPTQRSLALLRERGYAAAVVERRNTHGGVLQDLFGFIDIVAVHFSVSGVTGIQTTTMSNLSARQKKIEALDASGDSAIRHWLMAGNTIIVHGWAKKGPCGKRKLWACVERRARLVSHYGGGERIEWEEV